MEDQVTGFDIIKKAETIQGWMSKEELGWLYAKAFEMDSVVEIGSWKGRSAYVLLSICKGPVFCVDHFQGSPSENEPGGCHHEALSVDIKAEFLRHCGHFKNLRLTHMYSKSAASVIPDRSVDMVFIDGEHTVMAALKDLELWKPKAKKLFCGHDRTMPGVADALSHSGLNFKEGAGSIWYVEIG